MRTVNLISRLVSTLSEKDDWRKPVESVIWLLAGSSSSLGLALAITLFGTGSRFALFLRARTPSDN